MYQSDSCDSKKSFRLQPGWVAALLIVLALIVAGIVISNKTKRVNEAYFAERPVEVNDSINLVGVYTVRTTVDSAVSITTAEMTMEEEGYVLTVYSDYEPHRYNCAVVSDGMFRVDSLGTGTIMYRPAKSSVTITFKDNNKICELSK